MLNLLAAEIGNTWYLPFEKSFILWLQGLGGKGTFLYYLMNGISMLGEELVLVAVVGLLYWGVDKAKGERIGVMLIGACVLNPMIKNLACRTRPFDVADSGIQNLRDVSGYSFPSGHSMSSAATYGGTALTYRKSEKHRKWMLPLAVALPLLIALSRNYLGAHWLTDVVAGLLLGAALAFLFDFLLRTFNKYIIYIAMAVIGLLGLIYCKTDDYFTGLGLLLGFIPAVFFEEKKVNFKNTGTWWRILLRVAAGGGLFFGVNTLLKMIFKKIGGDGILVDTLFRTLRYAVSIFLVIGVYPLLFKPCEKLWRKIGWIKDEPAEESSEETVA